MRSATTKYVLRLGSEDETITGPHTYTIRYNYDLGLDTVKNADELYYNLVGTGWDTYIRRVQFSVTMPKDFDPAKLGLSTGSYGTSGTQSNLHRAGPYHQRHGYAGAGTG